MKNGIDLMTTKSLCVFLMITALLGCFVHSPTVPLPDSANPDKQTDNLDATDAGKRRGVSTADKPPRSERPKAGSQPSIPGAAARPKPSPPEPGNQTPPVESPPMRMQAVFRDGDWVFEMVAALGEPGSVGGAERQDAPVPQRHPDEFDSAPGPAAPTGFSASFSSESEHQRPTAPSKVAAEVSGRSLEEEITNEGKPMTTGNSLSREDTVAVQTLPVEGPSTPSTTAPGTKPVPGVAASTRIGVEPPPSGEPSIPKPDAGVGHLEPEMNLAPVSEVEEHHQEAQAPTDEVIAQGPAPPDPQVEPGIGKAEVFSEPLGFASIPHGERTGEQPSSEPLDEEAAIEKLSLQGDTEPNSPSSATRCEKPAVAPTIAPEMPLPETEGKENEASASTETDPTTGEAGLAEPLPETGRDVPSPAAAETAATLSETGSALGGEEPGGATMVAPVSQNRGEPGGLKDKGGISPETNPSLPFAAMAALPDATTETEPPEPGPKPSNVTVVSQGPQGTGQVHRPHTTGEMASIVQHTAPDPGAEPAYTTREILQKADEARGNLAGITWNIEILSSEKRNNRMAFQVQARGFDNLAEALYPAKDKGNKVLMVNGNMWFTKPNLSKPVPISRRQKLIGTAAYGDIASTNYDDDYDATPLVDDTVNGIPCHVFDLKASTPNATYDHIKYWVSKSDLVGVKAEYFTVSGKRFKSAAMEYANSVMVHGQRRPFISKLSIQDELMTGKFTDLTFIEPSIVDIPDHVFNLNLLMR